MQSRNLGYHDFNPAVNNLRTLFFTQVKKVGDKSDNLFGKSVEKKKYGNENYSDFDPVNK